MLGRNKKRCDGSGCDSGCENALTVFVKSEEVNSGQIITTSAEVTLNGGLIRELPQNPLNSG